MRLQIEEAGIPSERYIGDTETYDYTDMQIRTFFVPPSGRSTGITQNAGEATITGFELEVTARPAQFLTFSASLSYLDAEYDKFMALVSGTPVDVAGNPLQFTPNWKLVFGDQYEIPIREYGSLMLGGNLTWTDDQYFDHFKDPRHAQEAYTLINAFARFETWDEHWSFEFYGKNLAEEEYMQSTLDVIGDVYGYIGAPRTRSVSRRFTSINQQPAIEGVTDTHCFTLSQRQYLTQAPDRILCFEVSGII